MADDATLRIGGEADALVAAVKQGGDAFEAFVRKSVGYADELNKKLREVSGADVIAQAGQYVKAVDLIGGATKLNTAEQTKCLGVITQANAKFAQMGAEAPAAFKALETELRTAVTTTQRLETETRELAAAEKLAATEAATLAAKVREISGADTIAKAQEYAAAVEQIGGTSKLTTERKAELNAALTSALAHYEALGVEAPEAMRRLAAETTVAQKPTSLLDSTLGKLTASFTAASLIDRGIGMLTEWGVAAMKSAGDTLDLADKTGLTTDTIQEMAYVAKIAEVSVDDLGAAGQTLLVRLERGTPAIRSTVEGFKELGLTYRELIALSPDEQFNRVIAALERMEDPQERSRMAYDLLGGKADVVLRAVGEGWNRLKDDAVKSSTAQLKAADDTAKQFAEAAAQVQGFFQRMYLSSVSGFAAMSQAAMFGVDVGKLINEERDRDTKSVAANTQEKKKAVAVDVDYQKQLKKVADDLVALTQQKRDDVMAAVALNKSNEEINDTLGVSALVVEALKREIEAKKSADEQGAQAAKQHREEETKRQGALFGRDVIARANQFAKDLGAVENVTKLSREKTEELNTAVRDALATYQRLGEQAPLALQRLGAATAVALAGFEKNVDVLGLIGVDTKKPIFDPIVKAGFEKELDILSMIGFDKNKPAAPLQGWATTITGWARDLPKQIQSAFTGGGGWEGALLASASTFGEAAMSKLFGQAGKSGLLKGMTGMLGGVLETAMPVVGSLIGPALSKLGKLFGIGINDEVRKANGEIDKAKAKLIETHGPLEALEAKARQVGLSFEASWGHQGQAGLAAFNDLVTEFTKRWDALNKELGDTRTALQGAIGEARELGYEFDETGKLTGVNFKKIQEAAQSVGVDITALGPAFQQARLQDEALRIINTFTLMDKGLVDTGTILVGMKDEIGKLVGESIQFGTTIPKNMEPWVKNLFDTGQLLDGNGEKITDLSKIKFGDPVATEFEKISTKINSLIDAIALLVERITTTITPAIDHATRNRTMRVDLEIESDGNNLPGMAHGGLVTRPTIVRFAEGGEPELGGPKSFMTDVLVAAMQRVAFMESAVRGVNSRVVGSLSPTLPTLGGHSSTVVQVGDIHIEGVIDGEPLDFARRIRAALTTELGFDGATGVRS